jgi:hypothetical protein
MGERESAATGSARPGSREYGTDAGFGGAVDDAAGRPFGGAPIARGRADEPAGVEPAEPFAGGAATGLGGVPAG